MLLCVEESQDIGSISPCYRRVWSSLNSVPCPSKYVFYKEDKVSKGFSQKFLYSETQRLKGIFIVLLISSSHFISHLTLKQGGGGGGFQTHPFGFFPPFFLFFLSFFCLLACLSERLVMYENTPCLENLLKILMTGIKGVRVPYY